MGDSTRLKTARFAGSDIVSGVPTKLNALEAAVRHILGIEADADFASSIASITATGDTADFVRPIKADGGIEMTQTVTKFDTSNSLGGVTATHASVPTQAAVKSYVDSAVSGTGTFLTHDDTPGSHAPYRYLMATPNANHTQGLYYSEEIKIIRMNDKGVVSLSPSVESKIPFNIESDTSTVKALCYYGPGTFSAPDGESFVLDAGTLCIVSANIWFTNASGGAIDDSAEGLLTASIVENFGSGISGQSYAVGTVEITEPTSTSRGSGDYHVVNLSGIFVVPDYHTSLSVKAKYTPYNTAYSVGASGDFSIIQFPVVGMGDTEDPDLP